MKQYAHYNPQPKGCIQEGRSSAQVLGYLSACEPGLPQSRADIMRATCLTEKACNWALLHLRKLGRIEAIKDPVRNPRYLLYRVSRIQKVSAVVKHGA